MSDHPFTVRPKTSIPLALAVGLTATLLLPGWSPAQESEIILYDFANFGGESITFNESQPDLDPYGWDNDVESIRVVAGTWRIYRDDDYQEINGPSFELTPGDYPDIAQNPGFPHDRMSSVRLVADPEPQPTPTPTLETGNPCPAVVTLGWDVSSNPLLNQVRWELKDGPFTNDDGEDAGRIATGVVDEAVGSVEIDLREHGPVIDGSEYHFRVIGFGNGGPPPSDPVVFEMDVSSEGSYSATPTGSGIELTWGLPAAIGECTNVIAWEVKPGGPFTVDDGPDPETIEFGMVAGQSSGSTTIDMSDHAPGDYRVRLFAFHVATGTAAIPSPEDAVGRRGSGRPISVETEEEEDEELHELRIIVFDGRAYEVCDLERYVEEATVTALSAASGYVDGFQAETLAGEVTEVTLNLPQDYYRIVIEHPDCGELEQVGQSPEVIHLNRDRSLDYTLSGCSQPHDLSVELDLQSPLTVSREGIPIPFEVAASNSNQYRPWYGPSSNRQARLSRDGTTVGSAPVAPMCPGERREMEIVDPGVEPGQSYTYAVSLVSGVDLDSSNDRTVEKVAVQRPRRVIRPVTPVRQVFPDLTVSVSQSSNPVVAGQRQSYMVTIRNEGDAIARNVVSESELSENLDPVTVEESSGFSCELEERTARCDGPDLAPGASISYTVVGELPAHASSGHAILFHAHVDPDDRIAESDEDDNAASAAATTRAATMVEHRVDFAEARGHATLHGWRFGVRKSARASCGYEGAAITYSRGTCTFTLFFDRRDKGRRLTEPWKVKRVLFVRRPADSDPRTCEEMKEAVDRMERHTFECTVFPENDASPRLEVSAGFYDKTSIPWRWDITYILEGPEGADWREAFE